MEKSIPRRPLHKGSTAASLAINGRSVTMAFKVSARSLTPWLFAPDATAARGRSLLWAHVLRLVSIFPPVGWIPSNRFQHQRCFHHGSVNTFPRPTTPFQFIRSLHPGPPQPFPKPRFKPLPKVPMKAARRAVFPEDCAPRAGIPKRIQAPSRRTVWRRQFLLSAPPALGLLLRGSLWSKNLAFCCKVWQKGAKACYSPAS